MYLSPLRWNKRKGFSIPAPSPSGFAFEGGGTVPNPTKWGDWVRNQPAPKFKAGHRLHHLSMYIYGFKQEYSLAKELTDRWGYGLNVGYVYEVQPILNDAALANPVTDLGKLAKLALQDPVKYPIAAAVTQVFPSSSNVPEGYLRDASGSVIGGWSPEATPSAMQAAVDFKLDRLRRWAASGVRIGPVQDGGETGLHVPVGAEGDYGRDPRVVAARGSTNWVDYISRKKGEQQRLLYDAVKLAAPNRQSYIYYPNAANPYANIPGSNEYTWNYDQMANIGDVPSGSVYFRDAFSGLSGMANPAIRHAGSYFDQLTHWTAAVAEQIQGYSKQLSYSYVSAGYGNGAGNTDFSAKYFLPIPSFVGFLKCMYATGNVGLVAGYFSPDVAVDHANYTPFSPSNPPSWLQQQLAIGEVHARFSWLDEYLFDGDLLPGVGNHPVKSYVPRYEFNLNRQLGSFFTAIPNIRCFVRKIRNSARWLVVLHSPEVATGVNDEVRVGDDVTGYVRDIPGVETLQFTARGNGSIYTIDKTSGSTVVTQHDL